MGINYLRSNSQLAGTYRRKPEQSQRREPLDPVGRCAMVDVGMLLV